MSFRLANIAGRAALVDDLGGLHDIAELSDGDVGPDPLSAVADPARLRDLAATLAGHTPTGQIDEVTLHPPIPRPSSVFAVGLNYASHVAETNREPPAAPVVFTKFPGCISGPTDDIELRSETADYEVELVLVVGRGGRDIPAADAWDRLAGVMIGQDISDRALQFAAQPPHFALAKSRDGYGPTGPVIVSIDLLEDRDAIPLTCEVNGERLQDATTAGMIFDVPFLVEYISAIVTLQPGDLIFTGTPDGVGAAQGRFLKPGDVITSTIPDIGTLTNTCR